MRKRILIVFMVLAFSQLAYAQPGEMRLAMDYPEGGSFIDGDYVYAGAVSAQGQGKFKAIQAAKIAAQGVLRAYLVDSYFGATEEATEGNLTRSVMRTELEGYLRGYTFPSIKYHGDGSATAWTKYKLRDVMKVVGEKRVEALGARRAEVPTYKPVVQPKPDPVHNSLIVHVDGPYMPNIQTRIITPDNREVLGFSTVVPDIRNFDGVCQAAISERKAINILAGKPWNRTEPLSISGKVKKDNRKDVVITEADAKKVLAADKSTYLLSQGAVVIVYNPNE